MNRRFALLSTLLAAAICAPVIPAGSAQAPEQKPPEQKAPEKSPEQAVSGEKPAERVSSLKIPPEETRRTSTVKPDADSIAQGKHTYASQCAMCHGIAGDGKGDLAEDMKLKLYDYRDPEALKGYTDGDLFYMLSKGNDKMPGQGDRMGDAQKWNLINYIRSLSKKTTPAKKESKPSL